MNKLVRNTVCLIMILILCATMLTGCKGRAVRVSTMRDSASIGLVYLMEENSLRSNDLISKYKFQIYSTSKNAAQLFLEKDADIAIVSADTAARLARSNDDLLCLAYLSTADYAICSPFVEAEKIQDLIGKFVYVNGINSPGAVVLRYVYDQNNLDSYINTTINYKKTNKALREIASQGSRNDCIFVSQPFATSISLSYVAKEIIDIDEEFAKLQPNMPLIDSCVIARKKYVEKNPERISEFLSEFTKSIEKCKKDNAKTAELAKKHGFFSNSLMTNLIFSSGNCAVIKGEKMKADMSAYYKFLHEQDPLCIGAVPADSFYYIP